MEDGEIGVHGLLASIAVKPEPGLAITQHLLDVRMIVLVLPFRRRIVQVEFKSSIKSLIGNNNIVEIKNGSIYIKSNDNPT